MSIAFRIWPRSFHVVRTIGARSADQAVRIRFSSSVPYGLIGACSVSMIAKSNPA